MANSKGGDRVFDLQHRVVRVVEGVTRGGDIFFNDEIQKKRNAAIDREMASKPGRIQYDAFRDPLTCPGWASNRFRWLPPEEGETDGR